MIMNSIAEYKSMKNDKLMLFPYLLGLFSTMPIVGINVGTLDISFYRILFIITIFVTLYWVINKGKITIGKYEKKIVLWLTIGFFSCVCGWIFLSGSYSEWSKAARSNIPKVTSLVVFSLLWPNQFEVDKKNIAVAKGFFGGCIVNCVWSIIDASGYYLLGKSINNILFSGYIARNEIRHGMVSVVYGGLIRSSGFNYDPAQLGLMAPIVAGYAINKKRYLLLLIAFGAILSSASTTSLVTTIAVAIICCPKGKSKSKFRTNNILLAVSGLIIILGFVFSQWDRISKVVYTSYFNFFNRISSVYMTTESSNIRIDYLRYAPRALFNVSPFILLGTGFGTSSLGYAMDPSILRIIGIIHNFPYDMENTYLAYLFDTGIIGLFLFLQMIVSLFKEYKHRQFEITDSNIYPIVFVFICSSIVSMVFYHYILFGTQMLMFTIALCHIDQRRGVL